MNPQPESLSHYFSRIGRAGGLAAESLHEAVSKWEQFRDENNLGASELPKVTVIDTNTFKTVCTISYNGRCWNTAGEEIEVSA